MGKTLILAIVSLFLLSAFVISVNAAADGYASGDFPNRTFYVIRSPPGGPRSDTVIANMTPAESGYWSVRLDQLAGAAIIVQLYHLNGGVPTLESSSKLRSLGQISTPVALLAGNSYQAWFIPYGKGGQSILTELWKANAPPVACFAYTPTNPSVNELVAFDASCSTDSDGTIISYEWDFGDGTTGTGVATSHAYTSEGLWPVTLRVTDDLKGWDTKTQTLTVTRLNKPPVAMFTYSPTTVYVGDVVTFDASASYDPDGTIASYAWDFGDLSTGSGKIATHAYAAAGTYTVKLTVTDDAGAPASTPQDVLVLSYQNPVAKFSWTPLTPKAGIDTVQFDGGASYDPDGTIASYAWDFGDGGTATGATASHMYMSIGDYPVTLTVTDSQGLTGSLTLTIHVVENAPPIASFTYSPAAPKVGDTVTFDASASSDSDGTIASYAWDFGDLSTGSGKIVTHAYAAYGSYIVTLKVTDNNGASASTQQTVKVLSPPTASFTYSPLKPLAGETINFDASASSDADGTIATYHWVWGDGTSSATLTTPLASHAYATAGTYDVTLHVTDSDGLLGTAMTSIRVLAPPTASFTYSPATPKIGETVTFDASTSSDPDGTIASYAWDFGDLSTGSGKIVTHAYAAAGTYTVKLTVADSDALQGSAMKDVVVTLYDPPVAAFSYTPALPLVGEVVTFDASASYDPDGTIASYAWDFGDLSTGSGKIATHAYAAFGTYTVKLTVTDSQGLSTSTTKSIRIAEKPTASFTYSPAKPLAGTAVSFDASGSTDRDGTIVSYAWNFGDMSTGSGKTVSHTYALYGTYTVTLTVTDSDGFTASTSASVKIYAPPTADFTYSPAKPLQGTAVSFDASLSSDPDGTIASYAWDFGDLSTGSGKTVSHTYAAFGTYTVKLTVTDADGFSASVTKSVKIYALPIADFTYSPAKPLEGTAVSFDASLSSDPDGTIATYAWTFGDGGTGSGKIVSHTYALYGTYTVTLTVTDSDGFTATKSLSVKIYSAPTAAFSFSPAKPLTGDTVTFDASTSSDLDGTIASYAWDFGDLSTGSGKIVTHAYAAYGTYTVTLTVTDSDGFVNSASKSVRVYAKPTASFTYSPAKPLVGDTVTFDASTSSDLDGTIASYAWDFGDLSTGSGKIATHAYAAYGTYTVKLTVTDSDGFTASTSASVKIYAPPTALFTYSPAKPLEGTAVSFDASGSSDPDGSIATYAWIFGDLSTGSGLAPVHVYASYGVYTVTLTVTDSDGFTATYSAPVKIYAKPIASFTSSPAKPLVGDSVSFDASTSSDPDGTIATYAWDFGDGALGSGKLVSHVYATFGTYPVTLTVTDGDGFSASVTVSVKVYAPPTASFTFSPSSPNVGDLVSFDASASTDLDGSIVAYAWDFGDGASGSGVTASHAYAAANTYTVTLTVTDSDGFTASSAKSITVAQLVTKPVSWRYYDFFAVPYGEWWDMRSFFTADHPINADCFSADGITYGWCPPLDPTLPDTPSYPYTNWVPGSVDSADGSIFAPYRFAVDAKGLATYSIDKPVILPTCAELKTLLATIGKTYDCPTTMPSGGSVAISESIDYVTTPRAIALRDRDDGSTGALRGCGDVVLGNDGFLTEVKLTLTMDAAGVTKLFGVIDPTKWTPGLADTSLIATGCGPGGVVDPESGLLEKGLKLWLEKQGNGPYDVSNSLGVPYDVVFLEASGSYDSVTGLHTFTLDLVGHGNEVLTARWFYWGATSYIDGVSAGAAPAGWWGMEAAWFEAFRMSAKIGTDPSLGTGFDASVSGDMQNHFRHMAEAGPDGKFATADDVLKWVWMPVLADRFAKSLAHPTSELTAYAGYTYIHNTVGSVRYGVAKDYDYVPALWPLKDIESQRFEFPTLTVVLYDPLLSGPVINDPFGVVILAAIPTAIAFAYSVPATGVGTYDAATAVLTVIGPTSVGTPPTTAAGKPLESRPIYNLPKK